LRFCHWRSALDRCGGCVPALYLTEGGRQRFAVWCRGLGSGRMGRMGPTLERAGLE
jgi:hypothetical protein